MALKSKDIEEVNGQVNFDEIMAGMDAEYEEEREYVTTSGKPQADVSQAEQIKAYELSVGDEFEGVPELTFFENKDKKYDSLRVRVIDEDEYLDCYANIPKKDELGIVENVRKGFDFYRTCFDFTYSVLKYRNEKNVIDSNGEEVNKFNRIPIVLLAKYVDQMARIGVRITEGTPESDFNSWEIYKMEEE